MAAVETLEEWNKLLRCCCTMPSCPVPIIECQTKSGEASVVGYAPFVDPGGADEDLLPTIYRNSEGFSEVNYYGTGYSYVAGPGTFPYSSEFKNVGVWNGGSTPISESYTGNVHDEALDACESESGATWIGPFIGAPDETDVGYTLSDPESTATATECSTSAVYVSVNGTEPTLQGCPGPFSGALTYAWDYTKKETEGLRLIDPKTHDELIADAVADAPGTWPTGVSTTGPCGSSIISSWPTKGDFRPWSDCADGVTGASADVTAIAARFRIRVDDSHGGTWFRASWDLVFFPADGSDPEVVALDQTAEWTGPGAGVQDDASWLFPGGWREIPLPDRPGEVRIVNFRFECYRGPYGNLPQTTGEGYDIPGP